MEQARLAVVSGGVSLQLVNSLVGYPSWLGITTHRDGYEPVERDRKTGYFFMAQRCHFLPLGRSFSGTKCDKGMPHETSKLFSRARLYRYTI